MPDEVRAGKSETVVADVHLSGREGDRSAAQTEDYIDCGFNLNGLAIEQVWFIPPGTHCVQCRLLKHGRTTEDLQAFDRPCLGNCGLQHDCSLNAGRFSDRRVLGSVFTRMLPASRLQRR